MPEGLDMGNAARPDQIITLPKGGGALQGLGETFSPDLFTGTGNLGVPIAIPTGRNGFHPELRLVYSTGQGNGPFGLGWALSLPGVTRKTSRGVPRYRDDAPAHDERDVFLLSGSEDLVPMSARPGGVVRYRPRTEGLFARIERHRDPRNDYWEVRSRDGLASIYGTPGSAGNDPACVADPSERSRVYAWRLSRTTDPFGNRIEYDYDRDTGEAGSHHWDQLYLSRVRYVDYALNGQTRFLVTVTLHYEDRPDPFSEHRAGFEVRTRRRCARIEIRTHADADRLVRTYRLVYLDQRPGIADRLPANGISLLRRIVVTGHDGNQSEELPPLEFGYTAFEPDRHDLMTVTGPGFPGLGDPNVQLVDLFGSGLPDVVEMNGTVRYWKNLGGAAFDVARAMDDAPAGFALAQAGVQLLDANGDGRADLMVSGSTAGYFPMRFGGGWDRRSFQPYRAAPSFHLEDPEVQLVDLDGDGVTDAIRSGARLECFYNDPRRGWSETQRVERRTLDDFPNVSFSDERVRWADLSGDGLQDIALIHDGEVAYWPSLGHGRWGRRVAMRHSPRFPLGYQARLILVGDVDGDGLADVLYVDHCRVLLWINRGGTAWSDPVEITGTPPLTDADDVRLVDLLGSGVAGVLWSRTLDPAARPPHTFLDFTGRAKPYLLDRVDNHRGAITRVQYRPSTAFYLADAEKRETRWRTPLPFPVQVVARVERVDQFSRSTLTTEYAYRHGYWDGAEREFRGFGRVDQRDAERFDGDRPATEPDGPPGAAEPAAFSPPIETRTWFHLGPVGDEVGEWDELDLGAEFWEEDGRVLTRPADTIGLLAALPRRARRDALRALRGQMLRTELYALDGSPWRGRPYTVTELVHGVREEASAGPADGEAPRVFFPYLRAQRTTQWERGHEPMTRFAFTRDYDAYGQPRRAITIAVPRRRAFHDAAVGAAPYLATAVETVYAQRDDAQTYLVDRVARTTTYEILNDGSSPLAALLASIEEGRAARRVVGQSLSFYDGPAFQGLPFGQVGTHGALVRSEQLVSSRALLQDAYRSGNAVLAVPEEPPFLVPGTPPQWTPDYLAGFRDEVGRLGPLAGYVYRSGGTGAISEEGYFAAVDQRQYDVQQAGAGHRGLVLALRDPLDRETTIAYDAPYALLPERVVDPAGLELQARYDYRVLQPSEVTDANGNRRVFTFTPLGLPGTMAVMGKPNESLGDTPAAPGTRLVYDFRAFADRGQPVSVRTVQRVHHVHEPGVSTAERDETLEVVEYSDGFGRLLQRRALAEEVVFGDDPIFGGGDLPPDPSRAPGDAIGHRRSRRALRPRVVVSGWQRYDNKGRVVERYEPFFAIGWEYALPARDEQGQKTVTDYDPRGRVVRTVAPDGAETRVLFGVPDGSGPDRYTPTPWEVYTYDPNDNAGRTHGSGDPTHWDTPTSIELDALERTVATVMRTGPDPRADWYVSRVTRDIRGNPLTVTDPLHRAALRRVYDLANRPLRTESLDAGVRRVVLDAAGNALERRDSKGALILQAYDRLGRRSRLWARDAAGAPVTLRERLEYGDGADPVQPALERQAGRAANRLGRLHRHYDEAGLLACEVYDFKGNLAEKVRQVIRKDIVVGVFPGAGGRPSAGWRVEPFRVDWEAPDGRSLAEHAAQLLDPTGYRTSLTYDALDRVRTLRCSQNGAGPGREIRPRYNRAGALEALTVDREPYVRQAAYNARGQRILIAYGNGIMSRYAYDPRTFRLTRLRSEGYRRSPSAALTYRRAGPVLQDLAYMHDLAGNILRIVDRIPGCGVRSNPEATAESDTRLRRRLIAGDALVRRFEYDPLYRLRSATGRESADIPRPRPWADARRRGFDAGDHESLSRSNAPNLTSLYREEYKYDPADNLVALAHARGRSHWTRRFGMGGLAPGQWDAEWRARRGVAGPWLAPPPNRLTHVGDDGPGTVQTHVHDANGNQTSETGSRHFEWDHGDRLKAFRVQAGGAEPSVHAQYLYDAAGQRVMKVVRHQGGQVKVTVYIDGLYEHHRWRGASGARGENSRLHVMDGQERIAVIRDGAPSPGDTTPAVQYHLADHLGSSHVVVSGAGDWINREEYFPFGETSFGSFARKRYRFGGKERDEESGLGYHDARYYAPWLARWIATDPDGAVDGLNLYAYTRNNPTVLVDPRGTASEVEILFVLFEYEDVTDELSRLSGEAARLAGEKSRLRLELEDLVQFSSEPELDPDVRQSIERRLPEVPSELRRVSKQQARVEKQIAKFRKEELKLLKRGARLGITEQLADVKKQVEAAGPHRRLNEALDQLQRTVEELEAGAPSPRRGGGGGGGGGTGGAGRGGGGVGGGGGGRGGIGGGTGSARSALGTGEELLETSLRGGSRLGKVLPFIGIGANVYSYQYNLRSGNYVSAGLDAVGIIPGFGDVVDLFRLLIESALEYGPPRGLGEFKPEFY
jgi:RHS repeat-associated protein